MAEVKWIKITTNMFDDEKIKLIDAMPERDTIHYIWIRLLVQAGKTNANGYIFLNENVPYTEEMLSTIFNRPINSVRLALQTLSSFGMIHVQEDNLIKISNWDKHQNIEGMERVREQNRLRKRKQRENEKQLLTSTKDEIGVTKIVCHDMSRDSHAIEQEQEQEQDVEQEQDIEQQHIEKLNIILKDFSEKEIKAVAKICCDVDVVVEKWNIVKSMKKVKSKVGALITAIKEDWQPPKQGSNNNLTFTNYEQREYDYDALEKKLLGWDKE